MTPEEFFARVPFVYHMAEEGSWPSIERHGLLSTSALLDLFDCVGAGRAAIESARRPESVTIRHPVHGVAVVRDNKPMREAVLGRCLTDMTLREWYEYLNARCFFWCHERRLLTMLEARPYRMKEHVVLTVRSDELLRRYGDRVELARINTGATLYNAPKRGRETFVPLAEASRFPFAELVIPHSVPDVREATVRVDRMRGASVLGTLWRGGGDRRSKLPADAV